jgi:glycosyltransferase involved in cell wall biosynthesis
MNILFIGKRFYTNRDALTEKYGRIYQLPWHWSQENINTRLWLIDYHSKELINTTHDTLKIISSPVRTGEALKQYIKESSSTTSLPDVIVASGDCYIGLMAYRLAKILKAKFVFDVYDKYDEFGAYYNFLGFNSYKFLLKNSDLCLFSSKALEDSLKDIVKASCIVPNGVDTNLFKPIDLHMSRRKLGLSTEALYVGYFGSLDVERGIDDLLEAHTLLLNQGFDCNLLIGGKARVGLDLNRPQVTYLGNIPYLDVSTAMSACDLLALPYRRSPYLDMASSCKIAEYLCIQRPIVATSTPNILSNFSTQAAKLKDVMAEPNDPKDIAEKIIKQIQDPIVPSNGTNMGWKLIAKKAENNIRAITTYYINPN